MAVFTAFSDESGVEDLRGKFLVGGYAASEMDWPFFARAWQERVLDGPPPIPYLHMKEIRRESFRAKHNLTPRDAEDRVDEAIRLIRSTGGLVAVASTMLRADLEDGLHRKVREHGVRPRIGIDEPDYFCYLAYALYVLKEVQHLYPEARRIDFVVSKKNKITNHVKEFHDVLRELIGPPLDSLVGELIPGSMEDRLPLQAADVLCWHLQRHYAAQVTGKPDRIDEHRLKLLGETQGHLHEYSLADMEKFFERLIHLE